MKYLRVYKRKKYQSKQQKALAKGGILDVIKQVTDNAHRKSFATELGTKDLLDTEGQERRNEKENNRPCWS